MRNFAKELIEAPEIKGHIADALRLFVEPGATFELRALGLQGRYKGNAESAYFHYDDIDDAATAAEAMDRRQPRGIYLALNQLNPQLLARSPGEFSVTNAASDADVLRRRWILVDCDPVRPAETSSSEEQLQAAAAKAEEVHEFLRSKGWGEAVCCLSGNGRHLLFRIDLPNDDASTLLVKSCLRALAHLFNDEAVTIDTSVFNASRICRLYGTTARKGKDVPGYPHRRAEIIHVPDLIAVPRESLQGVADLAPANGHAVSHSAGFTTPLTGMAPVDPERIQKYMAKIPPGVQGEHGSDKTFNAAMVLVNDWALDPADAWPFMVDYNARCQPEWPEDELRRKLDQAVGKRDGRFGRLRQPAPERKSRGGRDRQQASRTEEPAGPTCDGVLLESDDDPYRLAREFAEKKHKVGEEITLVYWRDEFREYDGVAYREAPESHVRGDLSLFCKEEADRTARLNNMFRDDGAPPAKPFKVTNSVVSNALDAVRSISLRKFTETPCWMPGATGPAAAELIIGKSKLFRHSTGELFDKSPSFFCTSSLAFDPDPSAPEPTAWLKFGEEIFPGDPQSWNCLQEWFGYLLTNDTRLQKALAMIGARRSGKGTILRVLKSLTGQDNIASPMVQHFSAPFGLAGILNKSVVTITDARFDGGVDSGFVQHLLAITGEDTIDVHRKFLPTVTAKLNVRIVLVSNEPPRFTDPSGALASRFILLHFAESFEGREDVHLEAKLQRELPGILNWSIKGLQRLYERGRFIQPESGKDTMQQVERLASPISAFVDDCCEIAPGNREEIGKLFGCWKQWCAAENRREPGTRQAFGRQLSSAFAGIKCRQGTAGFRFYEGIRIKLDLPLDF